MGLQLLKNKLSGLDNVQVSLSRATVGSIAKLFPSVVSPLHGCLTFGSSGLSVSVDISAYLNSLPQIEFVDFCKCHGLHPAAIPKVIEGKAYCSQSRKRLEPADLAKGFALGPVEVIAEPDFDTRHYFDSDDVKERVIEFEVVKRIDLASLNAGFLFGQPFLLRGSTDPELGAQERGLHRSMLNSLCTELCEKDEALLMRTVASSDDLSGGTAQEPKPPPFGKELHHYLLMSDGQCAVALAIATKEHMRHYEDSAAVSDQPLPDQLKLVLEDALTNLGPSVEYNPLEYSGNFHERVGKILSQSVDIEGLQIMHPANEKGKQAQRKKGTRKLQLSKG